jgi:hypothetical protein
MFTDGEYGVAKVGTVIKGALMFKTFVLKSTVAALLTEKSPFIIVDPVICVDPEMNTDCTNGFTYEAVLAKEAVIALLAQLDVPNKDPVKDPLNEPVADTLEADTIKPGAP